MMPQPTTIKTVSKRSVSNEKLSPQELEEFMKKHGISEKEFAEIFGVTTQAVKLWLTGQREFSVTNSRLVDLFKRYPKLIGEF